ncbi:MAG: tRNA dihydrouridine synthase DusB [Treponema sp.]|jgi:nifR3 family TIM-barrel protein|nr:tRNA dihydrouridine synthase DusB [Treponema sp.]
METGAKDRAEKAVQKDLSRLYRPLKIGGLSLGGNLLLAPVAGYFDRSFRSLCVEEGANCTFTELVSAESVIRSRPDLRPAPDSHPVNVLLRRADNEEFYAVQLFGADPARIEAAAVLLGPWRPAALDINAGCPVPKVVKTGAGSALMRDPAKLGRVLEAAVRASRRCLGDIPVSVKIRSGWDSASLNYRECARVAVEAGAAMVSLHPRTRAQNYGGRSDWARIADLVSRLPVPVTGSGDLFGPEDAELMLRETGCAAVMFARGALGNPFIFRETRSLLATGSYAPVPAEERIRAGFRHLEGLVRDLGEAKACREMRKHFCAYTRGGAGRPGPPGGAALRNKLVRAGTVEDYRRILEEFSPAFRPAFQPE